MRYTVPDYYKKFVCLAGDCPATCCAGWQIVIDDRSLKKYAAAKGSVGNRIRNGVDFEEHTFLQYDKRCAFLNEENLCDMHIEAGVDMMCNTCRKYPRHIEVFDNEREITYSMSCPAAAKLILGQTKKAAWKIAEDEKEDKPDDSFDDFLYSALQDTRSLMIEILQDRSFSIYLRMAMVLSLAHDVQNRVNARQVFDIANVLARYQKDDAKERLCKKISAEKLQRECELLPLLEELEVLDSSWREKVLHWESVPESEELEVPESETEQMVIYYLFTYFCGAVYDGDLLAKAKMSIVSTLIWESICKKVVFEMGSTISFEQRCELAWGYSRELEHSDPNLNKMEEMMNEREEAGFLRLLGYLSEKSR